MPSTKPKKRNVKKRSNTERSRYARRNSEEDYDRSSQTHARRVRRDEVKERYGRADYYAEPGPLFYPGPPRRMVTKSSKPTIAGVLLILTGIIGFIFAAGSGFIGSLFGNVDEFMELIGEDDTSSINGEVTYDSGIPVENANVSIVGTDLYTFTDETGKFLINNVPVGKQKIQILKEGYNTVIYKAFIYPSEESMLTGFEGDENKKANYYEIELTPGSQVIEEGEYPPFEMLSVVCFVCAMIIAIFSLFAIIGGYFALTRKKFSIAIIGAILGIFSIGFIIGSILAIVAIVLLFISREEFRSNERQDELYRDEYY